MKTKTGQELNVVGNINVENKEHFIVDLGSGIHIKGIITRYIILPRTLFVIPGEEFLEIVKPEVKPEEKKIDDISGNDKPDNSGEEVLPNT